MACGSCGKNKLTSIIDGWKHVIWKDEETEKIAHERAKICSECTLNYSSWCKQCGCYIPAKIRAKDEKCPVAKW